MSEEMDLNQYFHRRNVTAEQMDFLWGQGWRHFGTMFFRYSLAIHNGEICRVLPLRTDLEKFELSRSHKRILAKNRDVQIIIQPARIDALRAEMFERHKQRFDHNVPESLHTFLSSQPDKIPCRNQEIGVYDGERLIAVSYLDIGEQATSGVYAMFEPDVSDRSPGILCILESIRYSQQLGCRYYYPGYAYQENSMYDYKKKFSGLEYLDWEKGWQTYLPESKNESDAPVQLPQINQ
jgi:arginine-tRNA-protein transferase